ncbi:hypothetical protein HELRODRAFT_182791 [Helobdella robusta]|uniref:Uncharacterized protein n=1 Tax=Helobdella robusta TaxID=6412 RepID=T1FIQ9_HELRO|nr:hypothetical protein HELRODRAFT_182791 [Helobdella robusta]ESN90097.1 hypothetical protein HELRODRAFT_182791 [Helobdella robusta]
MDTYDNEMAAHAGDDVDGMISHRTSNNKYATTTIRKYVLVAQVFDVPQDLRFNAITLDDDEEDEEDGGNSRSDIDWNLEKSSPIFSNDYHGESSKTVHRVKRNDKKHNLIKLTDLVHSKNESSATINCTTQRFLNGGHRKIKAHDWQMKTYETVYAKNTTRQHSCDVCADNTSNNTAKISNNIIAKYRHAPLNEQKNTFKTVRRKKSFETVRDNNLFKYIVSESNNIYNINKNHSNKIIIDSKYLKTSDNSTNILENIDKNADNNNNNNNVNFNDVSSNSSRKNNKLQKHTQSSKTTLHFIPAHSFTSKLVTSKIKVTTQRLKTHNSKSRTKTISKTWSPSLPMLSFPHSATTPHSSVLTTQHQTKAKAPKLTSTPTPSSSTSAYSQLLSSHLPFTTTRRFVHKNLKTINIKRGDVLGIYFPMENPIAWSTVPCSSISHHHLYHHVTMPSRQFQVGDAVNFRQAAPGSTACRQYSLVAILNILKLDEIMAEIGGIPGPTLQ